MIPALAVGAGAVAQWVSGIGFSLVAAPILVSVLGPREGVRVALVLSTVLNISLVVRSHREVMVREGALLVVPAVAITPLIAWASREADARVLAGAAGVLTVGSAGALLSGLRWRRGQHALAGVAAGALSGTMNVIGSIGGPAAALYAVNAGWPPQRMRPTLQVLFLISNLVALAALGLPAVRHLYGPAVGLLVGSVAGRLRYHRVPHDSARTITLAIAAIGGLAALARAIAGG